MTIAVYRGHKATKQQQQTARKAATVLSDNCIEPLFCILGERRDLMTIPSGATLIQFWFEYNNNKKHWLGECSSDGLIMCRCI